LESADLGERSNERRGRALCAADDGGELGSDLKGPAPLARERGVDGVPTLLLLVPPGVEGRWLEDGVEGRWVEDGVDGRWLEEGVLGLPLLLMGDSFGPDLDLEGSIVDIRCEAGARRSARRPSGEEGSGGREGGVGEGSRRGRVGEGEQAQQKGCKGERQRRPKGATGETSEPRWQVR
jgi:hypothetical protein